MYVVLYLSLVKCACVHVCMCVSSYISTWSSQPCTPYTFVPNAGAYIHFRKPELSYPQMCLWVELCVQISKEYFIKFLCRKSPLSPRHLLLLLLLLLPHTTNVLTSPPVSPVRFFHFLDPFSYYYFFPAPFTNSVATWVLPFTLVSNLLIAFYWYVWMCVCMFVCAVCACMCVYVLEYLILPWCPLYVLLTCTLQVFAW